MLGFDAKYGRDLSDPELAYISANEHRILLTRDRGLLMRSAVTHGYWLRQTNSRGLILAQTAKRAILTGFATVGISRLRS